MQNERKRILAMLENGTITTDEALTLLETLGQQKKRKKRLIPSKQVQGQLYHSDEPTSEQRAEEKPFEKKTSVTNKGIHPSMNFLEDLRKDFTNVGDRFMQFMQTAVQKVKSFDFDSPFGNSVTFNQTMTKPASGIEEVIIDIDNGKVTIHHEESEEVRAEFTVKTFNSDSEEKAKKDFLEKLLFVKDEGKLLVSSDMKMVQVNVELFIPKRNMRRFPRAY